MYSQNDIRPLSVNMGSIEEYILKIKVPTNDVFMEDLQELLKKFKAMDDSIRQTEEFISITAEVAEILWKHLINGFEEFDDQLLCSTCFYTVLTFSSHKEHYFRNILELINNEINGKIKGTEIKERNILATISMMYGIFQSSIINNELDNSNLALILNRTFQLVTLMAYEYSQHTFIVFKIMTFFKKVIHTNYQDVIFSEENNLILLNVINHNWENPINGIRSLNKIIFGNLITVIDEKMHEFILKELNNFYWNKAKYLMLSEIIDQHQSNIMILISKCRLTEGLIYSLNKPGLVSAGADMYIAIVKKITTADEWCTIFLDKIIETFKNTPIKPIENFTNYWCLNTFKLFPSLVTIIINKINTLNSADHKLFTCLCLMQQSHRLGLLDKNISSNEIEELIINGMEHNDAKIRAISFDILCNSQRKFVHNKNIYDIIVHFLNNNVSSDCSILRISMINSLQKLLLQNHRIFANNIRDGKEYDIDECLLKFCTDLQQFIMESLNLNGNYQRKMTTVQIIKIMLKSFTEVPRKKQNKGNKQHSLLHINLISFLINRHHWLLSNKQFVIKLITLLKDPSEDIREHVMYILLHNYSDHLCDSYFMNYLTEDALTCIRNKFFYQISCGHTIFKLILNLSLIKPSIEGQFKKVEDIFEFAFEALKLEYDTKMDIVKSIDEGKQLHSFLSILHNLFEVCLERSYKINISMQTLNSLLDILESISNQFAWEEESAVSSDFSKMNLMVHEIIVNSEHQRRVEDNETNISGLHQIVLNCLWLNVKASCQLSSTLIKYYKDDTHADICRKCLSIICHVLETSRHKGAIEAGGTALGQAIQSLTSSSEGSTVSKIPMDLLQRKLNDLISETSNMASVTRRGAGLSIMVHRIVSSDMKKGKPLFHFFMKMLLKTFNKINDTDNEIDTNNEKDLPKAIYIHFLTRIVIDSSLASDMLYYSANLAEIAFGNLTDSCWQIRNAALQLYGSLIPKLIGQKKKSGENEEVMATVAVDEFRMHSPKLWKYIVEQLKDTNGLCDAIQNHNNLVPILSVIANMAPKYGFNDMKEIDVTLLPSLISLLESPIYVVRRLTAKCLLNIYTFEIIVDFLLNSTCETENCLHGTLMLLNDFIKQYKTIDGINNIIEMIKCKYCSIMMAKNHSYLCRERFEYIFPSFMDMTTNMIRETLLEVKKNDFKSQGLFLWANLRIKKCLEYAEWEIIPEIITLLKDCSDLEAYGSILCNRLQKDTSIPEQLLSKLFNALYSWGFEKESTVTWKLMYEISVKTELPIEFLDTTILHKYLEDVQVLYRMRYILPLAARIFTNDENKEMLLVSKLIFKLCSSATSDVDMRLIAAMANNELAKKYKKLSDNTKINMTIAAIMFLQDEDEDIRNCSVHFYRLINMYEKETHPYICLKNILTPDFFNIMFCNVSSVISSFHSGLLNLLQSLTVCNDDDYNPFSNDSKNIYLEPEVIKQLLIEIKF